MATVYALQDPRDGRVRYVGCVVSTPRYLKSRIHNHLSEARGRSRSAKSMWLRDLLAADGLPTVLILETVDPDEASARERYWIATYRANVGDALTNVQGGGLPARRRYSKNDRPWSSERIERFRAAIAAREARRIARGSRVVPILIVPAKKAR